MLCTRMASCASYQGLTFRNFAYKSKLYSSQLCNLYAIFTCKHLRRLAAYRIKYIIHRNGVMALCLRHFWD